ncbi:H/ACA ribonucleoprotein complex subunit 2, partial [Striga asiatica]
MILVINQPTKPTPVNSKLELSTVPQASQDPITAIQPYSRDLLMTNQIKPQLKTWKRAANGLSRGPGASEVSLRKNGILDGSSGGGVSEMEFADLFKMTVEPMWLKKAGMPRMRSALSPSPVLWWVWTDRSFGGGGPWSRQGCLIRLRQSKHNKKH